MCPPVEVKTNILQHALSGHGLSEARLVPAGGFWVPGTWGPHTVPCTGAGMGGVPVLRQMDCCACRRLQPPQPHVCLFLFSKSVTVMLLLTSSCQDMRPRGLSQACVSAPVHLHAIPVQVSPATTVYEAQEPSAFWVGTGSPPAEQQTFWPTARVEHRFGVGL